MELNKKNLNNEKQILFMIKFAPPIFIIFLTSFIMFFVYKEFNKSFEKTKITLTEEYIKENKIYIKKEINNIKEIIYNLYFLSEKELNNTLEKDIQDSLELVNNIYETYKYKKTNEEITNMIKLIFFQKDKMIVVNRDDIKDLEKINQMKVDDKFILEPYEPLNLIIGRIENLSEYKENLQFQILNRIKELNTDKENNIFIFDSNKNLILNINENSLNNNLDSLTFLKGFYQKENLNDYEFTYHEKKQEKIAYIEKINDLNWYIGKSFFTENINKKIKEQENFLIEKYKEYLFNVFIFSTILIMLLMIISAFISEFLKLKFMEYKISLNRYVKENLKQQEIVFQQSKLASMGEMIENIAHQWRQPLSMITTLASGTIIQKKCNIIHEEQLLENLKKIIDTSTFLSQTIDDFRDFFKSDKEKEMFVMENCIKKTKSIIYSSLKQENIELIIHEPKNITLYSYENELIQVLLNIINNAKDILIEQNIEYKIIEINIYKEKENLFIDIKDNGNGIPLDIIQKIFDPYFTTKHKSQGTGIGLYMSKQIIEKTIGGLLTVENTTFKYKNQEYKGALFKIKIPFIN